MQDPLKTIETQPLPLPEEIKPSIGSIPGSVPVSLLDEKPRPSIIQPPNISPQVSNTAEIAPLVAPSPSLSSSSSSASIDIQNGKRTEAEGFIYITVKGTDEERGYAHGFLLADRIVIFIRTYAFFVWTEYGRDIVFFTKMINDMFGPILKSEYKEFFTEMQGIAKGVADKVKTLKTPSDQKLYFGDESFVSDGKIVISPDSYTIDKNASSKDMFIDGKLLLTIDVNIIVLLNCIVTVDYVYKKLAQILADNKFLKDTSTYKEFMKTSGSSSSKSGGLFGLFSGGNSGASDRCSAFMAVGEGFTVGGEIICAHITFDNYITGQFDNVILYMDTSKSSKTPSHNILMQTFPGGIFSSTDFFVTSAGFMGTETTIGGFNVFELHAPACVRSRKAMQYSNTLEDYVKYLTENNSGDYANVWYIGKPASKDALSKEKSEIMRIELGLRYIHVERKTKGYFIGFNACYDARIRNLECVNDGFYDIRRHSGARRVRLEELIKKYTTNGKLISVSDAAEMISDHYDVYLGKINMCSRTVCSHYDLDKREYMSQADRPLPNQPRGSMDGKICSSELCRNMQFIARWGNACGTVFDKTQFCNENAQWAHQRAYLENRPEQAWAVCSEVNIDKKIGQLANAIKKYNFDGKKSESAPATSIREPSFLEKEKEKEKPTASPPVLPPPVLPPTVNAAPAPVKPPVELGEKLGEKPEPLLPKLPINPTLFPTESDFSPQPQPQPQPQAKPQLPLKDNNIIQRTEHELEIFGGDSKKEQAGGYFGILEKFDNKKELKEFIKMFKKQNKKSYKMKNRNTKRNKKDDK
jgi:hypothetical protein